MSLIDRYTTSNLGIVQNHGEEPSRGNPNWGFYSKSSNQSSDALTNNPNFSKLHNQYSLNDNPGDLDVVSYNPEAWFGYPYDTNLDQRDANAPRNERITNYRQEDAEYKFLGPPGGRY